MHYLDNFCGRWGYGRWYDFGFIKIDQNHLFIFVIYCLNYFFNKCLLHNTALALLISPIHLPISLVLAAASIDIE